MHTFRLHDLGCKVNQYETQLLREGFQTLGLTEVVADQVADLVVVNTCSVTESGGAKSRSAVRKLLRGSPEARVLVTGCYAESDAERVAEIEGVDRVFGNREKQGIVPFVARRYLDMHSELPDLPRGITEFAGHTRAFVKIQDGCRDRCTFCIIPTLRGDVNSRDEGDILDEMRVLADRGYREIVLTGIHLGYYGFDRSDARALKSLLRGACRIDGIERLKLSSIEVHEIDEELVDLFADQPRLIPHFHLPLQAGSDHVLKLMRRRYNTSRFRQAVDLLRSRLDEPALTTDVIVGFPGESAGDFGRTLEFCGEMAFSKMHIFPYSVRRGTVAAEMPEHVPADEIRNRKRALAVLDDSLSDSWRRRFVGRCVPTLVEERLNRAEGELTGLTDRFVRVEFQGGPELMNEIVPVEITGVAGSCVTGRLRSHPAAV